MGRRVICGRVAVILAGIVIMGFLHGEGRAGTGINLVKGQTVYVPTYSFIYCGDRARKLNVTTTLSIRNTDVSNPIRIVSVKYHNSTGTLVRDYLKDAAELGPLSSTQFLVGESDLSGGAAPSFIVRWESAKEVNEPLIEAIMIGCASNQGISLVCPARVIAVDGSAP